MAPDLIEDDEGEEGVEQTDDEDPDDEPATDGGESGESNGDEDEEVAEAALPDDDGVDADAEGSDGVTGGILSKINMKAVVVISAVVVGGVILLRLVRGNSDSPTREARGGQGNANSPTNAADGERSGDEALEDQITAPDNEPLQQDGQMMDALRMGS